MILGIGRIVSKREKATGEEQVEISSAARLSAEEADGGEQVECKHGQV